LVVQGRPDLISGYSVALKLVDRLFLIIGSSERIKYALSDWEDMPLTLIVMAVETVCFKTGSSSFNLSVIISRFWRCAYPISLRNRMTLE
jgi:hypothetical protein